MRETYPNSVECHPAFEFVGAHYVESRQIHVQHFKHKKTGAVHYHLAADYAEEVFLLAFRTQPSNSKGVAHILEHTVLCGSEKYPVRDPFFSMMRRSLNSFMNAFTNSDWTAYPFATQNRKDFQNLLQVYLDAVFFPRLDPLDFAQEGIRVELENEQPVFKGVVFNEMKGALSPPSRRLFHAMAKHLYPSTTYHYNSGGEPAEIPDLTHAELKAFYHKHYHPSNAIFMTFGQQSAKALQQQFEELALQHFEQGEALHSVAETRFVQAQSLSEGYAISDDDVNDKTFHTLSWLLPTTEDIILWFGLRLVSGVLLDNAAAPLRHYLESCPFAKASGPFWGLNDRNYEMSFSCSIQGSNPQYAAQFSAEVMAILRELAAQPVAQSTINALLQQIELQQREISAGMPYGLGLCMGALNRLVHHQDPLPIWDIDQVLQQVRIKLQQEPMWLSELIQHYLIDNPHRVQLSFVPDPSMAQAEQLAEQQRLAEIAAGLDASQRAQLLEQAEQLKIRQSTTDDLQVLPEVTLADVAVEIKTPQVTQQNLLIKDQAYPLQLYPAACNGLYYQQMIIRLDDALLYSPYLQFYLALFAQVGAAEQDYLQLQQRISAESGGISMSLSFKSDVSDKQKISALLSMSCKSLQRQPEAMALLQHMFTALRLDEKKRILEILEQQKTNWKSGIANNGHIYAMQNASRNMSAMLRYDAQQNGLPGLNALTEILTSISQDDAAYQHFVQQLAQLHQQLLQAPKQFLLVSDQAHLAQLQTALQQSWTNAPAVVAQPAELIQLDLDSDTQDQAWLLETNVQFCAQAYPCVSLSHPDAAVLMVLGAYLRNGFLHQAIREKGGAYGAGANYDADACAFRFYSFRDPRLTETFADFAASLDWLAQQPPAAQALQEAILSIIAALDKPSSPASEAIRACFAELHGWSAASRQQLRQQILAVSAADLQRVSTTYLRPERAQRAVLAPVAQQQTLEQLGFSVCKVI